MKLKMHHALLGALVFTCIASLFLASTISHSDFNGTGLRPPPPPGGPFVGYTPYPSSAGKAIKPLGVYAFKVVASASPSVPAPIYNLRQCQCAADWKEKFEAEESSCICGGVKCPPIVNPRYLTDAYGQDICTLRTWTGYACYAKCTEEGEIKWYAQGCGGIGQEKCPDLVVSPSATPSFSPSALPTIVVPRTTWDPKEVYDFRGGGCELLNGKERCYMEDTAGRELCPEYVTVAYLSQGPPEYPMCHPSKADKYYCTIQCQEGNEVVRWGIHDIEDCYRRANYGNCPMRPTVIPKSEFTLKPWSAKEYPKTACQLAALENQVGDFITELSVGLLTHEPVSFKDSMDTYDRNGLLALVNDFVIYINNRNAQIDKVVEPYVAKYGNKIRVMGSPTNKGIARALVELTNAAKTKNKYFLFLERDFQLIEPSTCVSEQLRAGIDLIKAKEAHVIRYRSQHHAGRPNWAQRFFYGHEDDAFGPRQPNLACNLHYWIEDMSERWPNVFWKCGEDPTMICSDSYYCNWTNNPQLWEISWWDEEYVKEFDHFQRANPWDDIEYYMNWEPNAWNERGFIVAQGQGLFKHLDRNNIVTA